MSLLTPLSGLADGCCSPATLVLRAVGLLLWLQELGSEIWTYALEPEATPNLFRQLAEVRLSVQVGTIRLVIWPI